MATEMGPQLDFSYNAGSDLSTKQYCFVKISTGKLAVTGRGDLGIGVLQDKPAAVDRPGAVRPLGWTKVRYGGSITAGQKLVSDANAAAVNASSSDNNFMGTALKDGVAGDVGEMLLMPIGLS